MVKTSFRFPSFAKFVKSAVNGLLVILLLWGTVGNLVATYAKRGADRDVEAYIQENLKALPKYNDSALGLIFLSAQLGIKLGGATGGRTDTQIDWQVSAILRGGSQEKDFNAISDALTKYIDRQIYQNPTQGNPTQGNQDKFEPLPQEITQFLQKYQDSIRLVQAHLIQQPAPVWEVPEDLLLSWRSGVAAIAQVALPLRLNHIALNRLLLAQWIWDQQSGQLARTTQDLQASATLAHSLVTGFTLLDRLALLINEDRTLGIALRSNGVSESMFEDWLNYDYRSAVVKSLEDEFLQTYIVMNNLTLSTLPVLGGDSLPNSPLWSILNPLTRPYYIFAALNYYDEFTKKMIQQFNQKVLSPCDPEWDRKEQLWSQEIGKPAWWNLPGAVVYPAFLTQANKAQYHALAIELTRHVLTAKKIAARTGQWPQTLPNLASKTCPGVAWQYEVSSDGVMSLKLPSYAPWLKKRLTPDATGKISGFPLTFQTKQLPP